MGSPAAEVASPQESNWRRLGARLPAGALVLLIVAAYPVSLQSLLKSLSLDTPLAYLALVPLLSLLLALATLSKPSRGPDISDRYLDHIVGLPLLAAAVALEVVAPVRLSTSFWSLRVDILTLPLFVAGAVSLSFGVRTAWRLRAAIAFLFLAWPVTYQLYLSGVLEASTALTIAALDSLVRIVPVASPVPGGDGSVFAIAHAGKAFTVAVGSACAGVNGVLGFLLIGAAFVILAGGRLLSKLAWLASGMALIWSVNVFRILLIFAGGGAFGARFALDVLHPAGGLLLFLLAVGAMVVLLPTFRLRLDGPGPGPAPGARRPRRMPARRLASGLVIVLAAALVGGLANVRMADYRLVAGSLGNPTVQAGAVVRSPVPGWLLDHTGSYPWIARYLGEDATWNRYVYGQSPVVPGDSPFRAQSAVFLDVMTTSDPDRFGAYTVEQCYKFHGYPIVANQPVALGGGVVGRELAYREESSGRVWALLYWEWPVKPRTGPIHYERVVLQMALPGTELQSPRQPSGALEALQLSFAGLFDSSPRLAAPNREAAAALDFLAGFGRAVVDSAVQAPAERTGPAAPPWSGTLG